MDSTHRPQVVRKPVRRSECDVLFENKDLGWAIWFAVNRRVGEGKYGGPSLMLLRWIDDGDGGGIWLQVRRKDMFALVGFGQNLLTNHGHDDPWSLDDPDHLLYIQPGEDPVDVMLEEYEVPGRMAEKLDLRGQTDLAKELPFDAMIAAAVQVSSILEGYCATHGIEMPLVAGDPTPH